MRYPADCPVFRVRARLSECPRCAGPDLVLAPSPYDLSVPYLIDGCDGTHYPDTIVPLTRAARELLAWVTQ